MLSEEDFKQKFEQKFNDALNEGNFIEAFGNRGGLCRVAIKTDTYNGYKSFRISTFPSSDTNKIQGQAFSISLNTIDDTEAQNFLPLIEKIITKYGFQLRGELHTERTAITSMQSRIEHFIETNKEEYPSGEDIRGIYRIRIQQPTKRNPNLGLELGLRPFAHIADSKKKHLPPDHMITLGGLPANDPDLMNNIIAQTHKFLSKNGFENRKLETTLDQKKIIPDEWLDPQDITISTYKNNDYWDIILVKGSLKAPRTSTISFSTGTKDRENAEAVLIATQQFIIQQKNSQTPISIHTIKEHLEKKNLRFSEKVLYTERRIDIRGVFTITEKEGSNAPNNVATLFTPTLQKKHSEYSLDLNIAPPKTKFEHVYKQGSKKFYMSLGTSDIKQAQRMAYTLQNIAEAWLIDYFTSHPEQSLLTELKLATIHNQDRQIIAVKRQHDIGASDEVKAAYIDGETLSEKLRPAIEMARDLTWRVEVTPANADDVEGKQNVSVQAVHLFDDPLKPVGNIPIHPFDKEISLQADSPAAAAVFRSKIIASLLNKPMSNSNQPPNQHFSVDREVTHFGKPSATLVLRESLKNGLGLPGISVMHGQEVVSQWQRAAKADKAKENSMRFSL